MNSPQTTRRQLLTLAGVVAATGVVAPPAFAQQRVNPPRQGLPGGGLPKVHHHNPYRPLTISDVGDLPHFPADAIPVRWHWARSSHTTIQDAVATLRPNDVLVLPEDERPYEIDSSRGFRKTSHNWYSMAHLTRGLVGLGPGAIVRPSASAFRQGRQAYTHGLQEKMIECRTPGAYLGNFTMHGRNFGGVGYDATWARGAGTTWERIHFRGAHRGWLSHPPGEAGAICGYEGSNMRVYNCEVDCRDANGKSVGSSPLMWNKQSDVQLTDVYTHHSYCGMPTFWRVHNGVANGLVNTHVAQGTTHAPGVNVEDCSGHFQFNDCTFIIGYGPSNHGFHMQTGKQTSSIRFNVRNPTIDAGPWPGYFSIQSSPTTTQRVSDIHVTRASGSRYPFRVAGL